MNFNKENQKYLKALNTKSPTVISKVFKVPFEKVNLMLEGLK